MEPARRHVSSAASSSVAGAPPVERHTGWAAIVLAGVTLSALDLAQSVLHAAGPVPLDVWALTFTAVLGVTVAIGLPVLALRAEVHRAGASRWWSRGLMGAAEGFLLAWVAARIEKHATVTAFQKNSFVVVAMVALAGAYLVAPYLGRLRRLGTAAILAGAVALTFLLPFREKLWLRLTVELVALAALASVLAPLAGRLRRRASWWVMGFAVAVGLLFVPLLRGSSRARSVFFDFAAQGRAFSAPVERYAGSIFRKRGVAFGLRRCPSTRQQRSGELTCVIPPEGTRLPSPSRLAGHAAGADVLFLVVDALRWDHAGLLERTWKALGPHVRFTRAVTPAPGTKYAVAAMMRGAPARQVPFGQGVLHGGVSRGGPPTIGEVLTQQGYRSVEVATHWFFDPVAGIAPGFEVVRPRGEQVFWRASQRKPRLVRAGPALSTMLDLARTTSAPLLLWTHLVEPHEPYFTNRGRGPDSIEGYRTALRDLDPKLASFIDSFRAARRGRPLLAVVVGDHGEEFGEHGGRYHGLTVHAETARVVFALSAPALPESVIDAPVSISAAATTVLELLGVAAPCTFTLPSLLSCVENRRDCPVIADTQMVRKGRWIGYTTGRHRVLYDVQHDVMKVFDTRADPYEQRDLVLWRELRPAARSRFEKWMRIYSRRFCVSEAVLRARSTPP